VANIPVHNWAEVRGVADSDFLHELEGAAGQLGSLESDFLALQASLEQQKSRVASCRSEADASLLPQDRAKAEQWFSRAAGQGHVKAAEALGKIQATQ
jgi:TPR repeat protein